MAEIVKITKDGVIQYPITKPEAVIDENGKNVLQLIRENGGGGGGSYDDTGIKKDISDLKANDALQDAELAKLSAEIGGLKEEVLLGNLKANKFNKAAAIDGYYVTPNGLSAVAGWSASEFIPIKPNTTYSATLISNARLYGANKNYLGSIASTPFTTPSDAAYVRLSMPTNKKDTFMLNEGEVLKDYEPYGLVLPTKYIDSEVVDYIREKLGISQDSQDNIDYFERLRVHLSNPFVKTQIKLVGDSITAGMGGTGFSATGATITGYTDKANILTATCWANMLYHYINDVYNVEHNVSMNDNRLTIPYLGGTTSVAASEYDRNGIKRKIYRLAENNSVSGREFCSFSVYADKFAIYVEKSPQWGGIFDVYSDGEYVQSVDCFASELAYAQRVEVSLPNKGLHQISLRCTATKNASSSMNQIRLDGLGISKTAVVKNFGIGGTTSDLAFSEKGIISNDDDFVVVQLGTNDRHIMTSPSITYSNLKKGVDNIINLYNAIPILMCSCPASERHETTFVDGGYYFHMNDVHDVVARLAEEYGMPYIDNYSAFLEYADNHNILLDELLNDGLHPNDLGYKVMYYNIMKSIGLARLPYYREWLGENFVA